MDYSYPSVFFSYFLFFLFMVGAAYFLIRSIGQGYWGPQAEDVKYRMLQDEEAEHGQ